MRYRSGRFSTAGMALVFAGMTFAGMAYAQQEAVYVVTHVDTIPNSAPAGSPSAAQVLKQLEEATVKEPGCIRFEVLQQSDRANHFALVGVWRNQKAFDDHEAAPHTKAFRDKIQPMMGSPFDERLHHLLK
jgi:quinol monooxygenase YgiN